MLAYRPKLDLLVVLEALGIEIGVFLVCSIYHCVMLFPSSRCASQLKND